MTHEQVKHYGHSHRTVSKILRAVEVHHSDSKSFNDFLRHWKQEMEEFYPQTLGMTGNLYVSQPKDVMLEPHSDTNPGFVMQLSGRKTWRICNRPEGKLQGHPDKS